MTVLMPSWYYEKKDLKRSPSILDGIDMERESRYRREGARFIINVGTKMGLRYDTMATGVVYFHRFYMFHSFKTFPRYVTACCCLFLAGKVEETPKKCKDIIRIAKTFLADSQFTQFGDDPKEEVMTLERILLQTIKFDLQMDHPYGHLLKYAKSLKGDKVKLQNMVQMAWTFINDSLCTTLCLQFEPEVIAIALMYLAGKLSKFEVVDWVGRTARHSHWWDMFVEGMSIELLEDICHQVLDLYSTPMSNTPQDSPPATPPTKSTRKSSQPPSPVEAPTSPAQTKSKETIVGQPIPRLDPGELKRKVSQPEVKKELAEGKKRRATEGKAIPIITSNSPKGNSSTQGSDTQPSSPTTPGSVESTAKTIKHSESAAQRNTIEVTFRTGISSANQQSHPQGPPALSAETTSTKPIPHVASVSNTNFPPPVPPPSATYTQPTATFYTGVPLDKTFPNVQQPPPQIFPLQFPPPPGPPPPAPSGPPPPGMHPSNQFGDPPHQFPAMPPGGVPPFNSQFPPPRHQPPHPPSIINNPPPGPMPGITQHPPPPRPQGPPPDTGMIRSVPPPNMPNVVRPPRMMSDNPFSPRPPGTEMFNPRPEQRGGRLPPDHRPPTPVFGPRPRFEGDKQGYRGRREPDYDGPFTLEPPYSDQGFHRPPQPNQFGQNFERPPRPPPRRFPLEPRRNHERGPRPPMGNNMSRPQGAPTGIPPVRITGSM